MNIKRGFYFGVGFWLAGVAVTIIPLLISFFVARAVIFRML
ncbi:MAG: hypothetical protein SCK29_12635 [Bacillota bacterium]|nr:hypothetical protein [Bacillota bacterium]MDW7684947.1 hypothetical protein [Bacillota bacterium]